MLFPSRNAIGLCPEVAFVFLPAHVVKSQCVRSDRPTTRILKVRLDDFIIDGAVEVYRVNWFTPLSFVLRHALSKSSKGRLALGECLCMLAKVDGVGGCGCHAIGL